MRRISALVTLEGSDTQRSDPRRPWRPPPATPDTGQTAPPRSRRCSPATVRTCWASTLIADLLRQVHLLGLPTIVTGDLNSVAQDSPASAVLVEDSEQQDSWLAAEKRLSPS
ncbi:hypothetical protein BH708_14255 [Brachybacterium sp. P6-10-X1]|nr:hypothetical protein BH708_14255 [Brachybacterium sp. P6-10-X1]